MRRFELVMILLIFPALLVDAVNGWMIREYPSAISISQIYRITLLALMTMWLASFQPRHFVLLLSCGTTLLAEAFYHVQIHGELSWLVTDLHFNIRMVLHFVYFLFFWSLTLQTQVKGKNQSDFADWVPKLFVFSFLIIAANIIMGSMGIGYTTVSSFISRSAHGYGGLGFFKAGNDVSSTYLVIIGVLFYLIWIKGNRFIFYIVFSLCTLWLAILLQTKVSILGTMLVIVGIPLMISFSFRRNLRINKRLLLLLLLGGGAIVMAVIWLLATNVGIVAKFKYYYEQSGLVFAMFTGRSYFLDLAVNVFSNNFSFLDMLFGHGWSYYLEEMGSLYGKEKLVEIDYADIFMINGIVGLAIEMAFWWFYLATAYKGIRISPLCRVVLFIDLLLLAIAATAGHVLYSTVNCMFIGLLNALPLMQHSARMRRKNNAAIST